MKINLRRIILASNLNSTYDISYVDTQNILTNSKSEGGVSYHRSYEQSIDINDGINFIVTQKCNFHWSMSHDYAATSRCEEWTTNGNIKNFSISQYDNDSDGGIDLKVETDPGLLDLSNISNSHITVSVNSNNLNSGYSEIFSKAIRDDMARWYYKIFAKVSGNTMTIKYEFQILEFPTDNHYKIKCRISWFSRSAILRSQPKKNVRSVIK